MYIILQTNQSPVHCETTLYIVDDPEVLSSLLNLDDIHEAGGELWVSPGLAIDLDQALLHDRLHLLHAQSVLDSIPGNISYLANANNDRFG